MHRYVDVARMLHKLMREGLIKSLGLTNFDKVRTVELLDVGIPIASNQVSIATLVTNCHSYAAVAYTKMDFLCLSSSSFQVQLSLLDQRPVKTGLIKVAQQ